MADPEIPQQQEPEAERPPKFSTASAPQRVEVVVENQAAQGEVNIPAELAIFLLRITVCVMMFHHGLEKLQDPGGFAEFVVGKYFGFLPGDPIFWTFAAAATQLICPIGLSLGLFARLSSLGLLSTMLFAITFHALDTGLEGFPFAVVEAHNYAYELSTIYAVIFFYFLCAGPGRLSLAKKSNKITYYPSGKS